MEFDSDFEDMLLDRPQREDDLDETCVSDSDNDLLYEYEQHELIFPDDVLASSTRGCTGSTSDPTGPEQEHAAYDATVRNREWVIARIEQVVADILDKLADGSEQMYITLKSRASMKSRKGQHNGAGGAVPPPQVTKIRYPGSNAQEAWRFTLVLRILELVHCALVDNVVMTKRDIYYRHPDLFVKQSVVDRYVDDIACTFDISRSALNVSATAKGLIAGNFIIYRTDGTHLHGLSDKEGLLIPAIQAVDILDMSWIDWVLVIEKEAKGYPDLISRKFLHQLAQRSPTIPMYILVDHDPDGIAILSTYKYGSLRLAHEHVSESSPIGIALPQVQWLGIGSHHYTQSLKDGDRTPAANLDAQGLMRLTPRDRTKATQMLSWTVCDEHGSESEWRLELQRMLMLNVKAEIQILDEVAQGLGAWVEKQLNTMQGSGVEAPVDYGCAHVSEDELLF